ncbi:fibronectin type III-like domain-contianing protein [Zunongwangia endophytica]|uniref:Fibronectin type III-like domain-contianing protein n=1 Tax=Zunongwangia endophytica TaxID=1808945 RepID=A0ABV8HB42_9FLAO
MTGYYNEDENVQLYVQDEKASTPVPILRLAAFDRIYHKNGETKEINLSINPRQLAMINKNDKLVIEPGWFGANVRGKLPEITKTQINFLKIFRIKEEDISVNY